MTHPATEPLPDKVCVIGAGASGLPAIHALSDRAIPFDAFETSSVVGGLWVYDNPSAGIRIAAGRARMSRCYVSSKRHTIQVDFDPYMDALKREW